MPISAQGLPDRDFRASLYVSAEERETLLRIGGPAVREILVDFAASFLGKWPFGEEGGLATIIADGQGGQKVTLYNSEF